jgi:hypothetical protein
MDDGDAIDISYIPKALTAINDYLRTAQVAYAPRRGNDAYRRAAKEACGALQRLVDHAELWEKLGDDYRRRSEALRDLQVPVAAKLLDALGYAGQQPAAELIADANKHLRDAAGLSSDDDPVTAAQRAVGLLCVETCEGKELADAASRRHRLEVVRNALVGIFVAAVVIPEVQESFRLDVPDPQTLMDGLTDLADRAGDMLSSLSLGAVVAVADQAHPPEEASTAPFPFVAGQQDHGRPAAPPPSGTVPEHPGVASTSPTSRPWAAFVSRTVSGLRGVRGASRPGSSGRAGRGRRSR